MWICSKFGFFSIVKKGQPDTWHVRARSETDLRALLRAAGLSTGILSTPRGDYAYRILLGTEDLSRVFAVLVCSIDYPNFKSCLEALPQHKDKLHAYQQLWTNLRKIQDQTVPSRATGAHAAEFNTSEKIAKRRGGDLARVLETLNGFKEKYGHWPTKLRLPAPALESLRDKHLTPPAFQTLQSKLELVAADHERLIAEDDAGLKFDYIKEGWLGRKPPRGSDEWLWRAKL